LRDEYINPFTKQFQAMADFFEDVKNGALADYSFIEPRYDTGNNYLDGNSMHPLNDIRKGEDLLKRVYEALRNSQYWTDTMLIITFDEHGGFYDHQPPPATVPTGDDSQYANPNYSFQFNRLGIRVPAMVVSAYTAKGTIIGDDPANPATVFDHSSVLATVEKRFGLASLTKRDAAANTLEVAINLATPRLSPTDAPTKLPAPAADAGVAAAADPAGIFAAAPQAPLSANQKTMAALALACELEITPANYHAALISNHQKLVEQKDAADYIQKVEDKIASRRKAPPGM
jgi:phospholipase C